MRLLLSFSTNVLALFGVAMVFSTWDAAEGLAIPKSLRGGGRAPGNTDNINAADTWEATPCTKSECRLIICHITDVYTLENFASFKTLVEETKRNSPDSTVISVLTGDFLCKFVGDLT